MCGLGLSLHCITLSLILSYCRCGEYANCFALILASLGFDTRHVVDWTDHVWCEVWIDVLGNSGGGGDSPGNMVINSGPQPGRWVHCDPAEAAADSPLMYEQGWGKVSTALHCNAMQCNALMSKAV